MGMSFHSDNEPGLGNVIASLSMGATCKMQFRVREKFPKGTSVDNADELKNLGKGAILTLELGHVSSPIKAPRMHLNSCYRLGRHHDHGRPGSRALRGKLKESPVISPLSRISSIA